MYIIWFCLNVRSDLDLTVSAVLSAESLAAGRDQRYTDGDDRLYLTTFERIRSAVRRLASAVWHLR